MHSYAGPQICGGQYVIKITDKNTLKFCEITHKNKFNKHRRVAQFVSGQCYNTLIQQRKAKNDSRT